ncbi:helix-turn-helix domain-containing protein [Streptomyces sp. TBY4]|uniref:helix-turn-helix domain-containing protein n=1 Tax=Streptomyces sp. TBY4 TaxID=2962030 RepID=UPI0020B8E4CB|nr:helix-turn-helix domain-containing protein [Streptomyces sp. TBY4]MCP3758743.1 helix-turn-helix domain-containing protein [Streptomyces sp. TBY4]
MPAVSDPRATLRRGLPDRYLTPDDIAELFDVPLETVYQWRKKRTGPPGFRVGKHVRYDPTAVHSWIAEQMQADISNAA